MIMGHTAGVAAALAAQAGSAVQDVDRSALAGLLRADGQILSAKQLPPTERLDADSTENPDDVVRSISKAVNEADQ